MTGYCLVCGKELPANATVRKQTCSNSCRTKLHRQRKALEKEINKNRFDLFQANDIKIIKALSPEAVACIERCRALGGGELGGLALNAVLHTLTALGKHGVKVPTFASVTDCV